MLNSVEPLQCEKVTNIHIHSYIYSITNMCWTWIKLCYLLWSPSLVRKGLLCLHSLLGISLQGYHLTNTLLLSFEVVLKGVPLISIILHDNIFKTYLIYLCLTLGLHVKIWPICELIAENNTLYSFLGNSCIVHNFFRELTNWLSINILCNREIVILNCTHNTFLNSLRNTKDSWRFITIANYCSIIYVLIKRSQLKKIFILMIMINNKTHIPRAYHYIFETKIHWRSNLIQIHRYKSK